MPEVMRTELQVLKVVLCAGGAGEYSAALYVGGCVLCTGDRGGCGLVDGGAGGDAPCATL